MFGCMFWETGCNLRAKRVLIKYNWIAQSIVAISTTLGCFSGDVTVRLMALSRLTNWVWIPSMLYFDLAIRTQNPRHEIHWGGSPICGYRKGS